MPVRWRWSPNRPKRSISATRCATRQPASPPNVAIPDTLISQAAVDYLRLTMVRGVGPRIARQLLATADDVAAFWRMEAGQWRRIDGVGERLVDVLQASDASAAERVADQCRRHRIHVLCPEDASYPGNLKQCDDAPLVLFVYGEAQALCHPRRLAVVGARKASREGRLIARRWSQYCSERGVAIVSGMAYGIDAAAHGGALEGDSPTVAVLGCGLLAAMQPRQREQVEAIAGQGCVVSEFLPDLAARPEHFPSRNRIIAGLCDATLVIEADVRSGSLITAQAAAVYGREVLAVPGSVLGSTHAGCHQLIRDGATLVDSGEAVLQQLGWQRQAGGSEGRQAYRPADKREALILDCLRQSIAHIDMLAEHCGLTLSELSPILLALELQGVVERLPGSRYTLGG